MNTPYLLYQLHGFGWMLMDLIFYHYTENFTIQSENFCQIIVIIKFINILCNAGFDIKILVFIKNKKDQNISIDGKKVAIFFKWNYFCWIAGHYGLSILVKN